MMLNVTAIRPAEAGFLTVFDCEGDRPTASSVNFGAGEVVPNAVFAKLSSVGTVCVFSTSSVDLVVDVNGHT